MTTNIYEQSWQGRERAQQWERRADLVIPKRQEIFSVMVQVLPFCGEAPLRMLDLGCGTGSLAEMALARYPNATVTCLDNSPEMLEIGQAKYADQAEHIHFLLRDLEQPDWNEDLGDRYDAILSCLAIHLISDDAKRRLYRQVFQMLTPAGCFVSADRLRAATPALDALYHELWLHYIVHRTKEVLDKDVPLETVRERQRTMDASAGLKCATLEENLAWLREAGFPVVECFWKDYQRAVFGGFKADR